MWKHIQRCGLQERYMNDPQFSLQLSMIAALAFVPPQDVVNSFDEHCVVIQNQYDGDADEMLDYFDDTYNDCFRRNAFISYRVMEHVQSNHLRASTNK